MSLPDFFAIDIGKHKIKLVQTKVRDKEKPELVSLASIGFPEKLDSAIPNSKEPEKLQLLASVIKSLAKSAAVTSNQVVIAIPERLIFSRMITLPMVEPAKLEETIHWEAKQFVPLPMSEVQMDWFEVQQKRTGDGRDLVDVMVIAAPKKLVEGYLKLFELSELELIALEVESVALARAVNYSVADFSGSKMIIDIGYEGTDVCVTFEGKVMFTQSIAIGSDALTNSIATNFGLDHAQAEQYKMAYGLRTDQADGGKIFNALKPNMELFINEVEKIKAFVVNRLNYPAPTHLHLSGNGALLPGLEPFLQTSLGFSTNIVDPFTNFELKGNLTNIKSQLDSTGFTIAAGLSLKSE